MSSRDGSEIWMGAVARFESRRIAVGGYGLIIWVYVLYVGFRGLDWIELRASEIRTVRRCSCFCSCVRDGISRVIGRIIMGIYF